MNDPSAVVGGKTLPAGVPGERGTVTEAAYLVEAHRRAWGWAT